MVNTQKVTLSLNKKVYNEFLIIKKSQGLSISAWVTSKMIQELKEYESKEKSLQEDYNNCMKLIAYLSDSDSIDKELLKAIFGEIIVNDCFDIINEMI